MMLCGHYIYSFDRRLVEGSTRDYHQASSSLTIRWINDLRPLRRPLPITGVCKLHGAWLSQDLQRRGSTAISMSTFILPNPRSLQLSSIHSSCPCYPLSKKAFNMTSPIPTPPGLPLIGNIFDVDSENQLQSLTHLADIYGTMTSSARSS